MSSLISFSFCLAFLITVRRPIAVRLKAGHAAAGGLDGVQPRGRAARVSPFKLDSTHGNDHRWFDGAGMFASS